MVTTRHIKRVQYEWSSSGSFWHYQYQERLWKFDYQDNKRIIASKTPHLTIADFWTFPYCVELAKPPRQIWTNWVRNARDFCLIFTNLLYVISGSKTAPFPISRNYPTLRSDILSSAISICIHTPHENLSRQNNTSFVFANNSLSMSMSWNW